MRKKWIILIAIIVILSIIIGIFASRKRLKPKPDSYPEIILKGSKTISLTVGEEYTEPGFRAQDMKDGDLTTDVVVKQKVDSSIPGSYVVEYEVANSVGHKTYEKRIVTVTVAKEVVYKDTYDKLDNQVSGWGIPNKRDQVRPVEVQTMGDKLKQYNAYFIGPDEKVLYLTFDEGSNDTYLDQIIDVLDQNQVKATFFLCKRYILDNEKVMKKLVSSGHSVGNHTANHYQMPKYATRENFQKYLNEIYATEEAFKQVTGTDMDRIYREPKGEWSYRSLQIMKDLGYQTYFWSVAYMDYGDTLTADKAYYEMTTRYHNGAVYLIHPKNKGNYEALDRFIKQMKSLGYRFDLVKNIVS